MVIKQTNVVSVSVHTWGKEDSIMYIVVYYKSMKGELNKRLIFDFRCDPRLKVKDEGCTLLVFFCLL